MGSYGSNGKLNLEELNDNLKNNISGLTYKGKPIANDNRIEDLPAIVVVDGYNVKIHENGNVTLEGEEAGGNTSGGEDTPNPPTPPVSNIAVPGEIVTGEENKTYTKNGTAIIPVGFGIVPGLDDISEGLVISDVANDTEDQGNQFVWIPVADETQYERNRSYIDVNVSTIAYDDTNYLPDGITDEGDAVRSVGGFYISRYEAGKEGTNTLVSKKGATVWNNISQENAKETAKTMYIKTNAKSALISGVQWDMTMGFIASKPRVDGKGNEYDVTKAVVDGASNRHIGTYEKSGSNEADKVCNIYDLEGNYHEYVAEKSSNVDNQFIGRSGYCGSDGTYSASERHWCNGLAYEFNSFRLVLYVL